MVEEILVLEMLSQVNNIKADLEQIMQNCNDLTTEQQSKLLHVLKEHKTLLLGKWGNWKGQPVMIKVIEGATPV
jgi:transcriptional regulator of acetoin/glycerol metabolism